MKTNQTIQKKPSTKPSKQGVPAKNATNAGNVSAFETKKPQATSKPATPPKKTPSGKPKSSSKRKPTPKKTFLHRFFQSIERYFTTKTFFVLVSLILVVFFLLGLLCGFKLRSMFIQKEDAKDEILDKASVDRYIKKASDEFGVPYDIIYAIIETESSFRPKVVSPSGARGLMQIMPGKTLEHINQLLNSSYEPDDLFDPEINVRLGTRYLAYLYTVFDVDETVYAAYNAGVGTVLGWLEDTSYSTDRKTLIQNNIPKQETKDYVVKVSAFRKAFLESQK